MNDYINAISSVGFPIVCCIAMFVMLNNESKNHKDEVDSLKEVITSIKITLQELTDTIKNIK